MNPLRGHFENKDPTPGLYLYGHVQQRADSRVGVLGDATVAVEAVLEQFQAFVVALVGCLDQPVHGHLVRLAALLRQELLGQRYLKNVSCGLQIIYRLLLVFSIVVHLACWPWSIPMLQGEFDEHLI